MQKNDVITEKEYRFVIPRQNINLIPPIKIAGFKLQTVKSAILEDVLLESKGTSLKSENIGIRARKNGRSYEVTYKKFLGKKRGAAVFDEYTVKVSQSSYEDFQQGKIKDGLLPMIDELIKQDELYIFLIISNKRKIYFYTNDNTKLEMVVEDLRYQTKEASTLDAMVEVEIKSSLSYKLEIQKFVDYIKNYYSGQESDEGKNSRAMTLLKIPYI